MRERKREIQKREVEGNSKERSGGKFKREKWREIQKREVEGNSKEREIKKVLDLSLSRIHSHRQHIRKPSKWEYRR